MTLRLIPGALALALCASATVAEAAVINFNPTPDPFLDHPGAACSGTVTAGTSCYSYGFDYTLPGYDPALHLLSSASLTFDFYDDDDDRAESVNVFLDDVLAGVVNLSGTAFAAPSFNVLSQLQADGLLRVLLQVGSDNQGNNDFYFQSASLVATWQVRPLQDTTPAQTAPEPVELVLFGTAVMAFALRLRRKS